MRMAALFVQDVRFQFRHGFYYAYAVLSILYILLLRILPDAWVMPAFTLILFSDVTALGFFFVGAILLLERNQNITDSLFVTPLHLGEYLLSKQLSFLFLSLISALIIMLGAGIRGQGLLFFLAGLILSASLYTIFGLAFAARAKTVNDYFGRSLGLGMILSLPLISWLGFYESPLFWLFPTQPTLILLDILGTDYSLNEKLAALSSLLLWLGILARWTHRRFEKYVVHPA